MKILILGANGMLGHQLWLELGKYHIVYGTLRSKEKKLNHFVDENRRLINDLHAENISELEDIIKKHKVDVIINCIGIVKQIEDSRNHRLSILVNSLFPHQVASISGEAKVIQISTDCVFSGNKGNYRELDFADANDLYGRTKYLGEIDYDGHLTIRTSIVGHELNTSHSLFDWFLSREGKVDGYTKALYSGLTTLELSKEIKQIIESHFYLEGIWHISSKPIDKYSLLKLVAEKYNKRIDLVKFDQYVTDKTLDHSKIGQIGYSPKSWESMISELQEHYSIYKDILYTKH